VGASFDIKRRSGYVGTNEYGNRYFEGSQGVAEGRHRRYVCSKGLARAIESTGRLDGCCNHTVNEPPTHIRWSGATGKPIIRRT